MLCKLINLANFLCTNNKLLITSISKEYLLIFIIINRILGTEATTVQTKKHFQLFSKTSREGSSVDGISHSQGMLSKLATHAPVLKIFSLRMESVDTFYLVKM